MTKNIVLVVCVLVLVGGVMWMRSGGKASVDAEPDPARPSASPQSPGADETVDTDDELDASVADASEEEAAVPESLPPAITVEVNLRNLASEEGAAVPASLPRLVELGAGRCLSCRQMKPIIEAITQEYAGRVEVENVDVFENPARARDYNCRIIPTQVFIDADGKEVWRNEGFLAKDRIVAKLREMGVE